MNDNVIWMILLMPSGLLRGSKRHWGSALLGPRVEGGGICMLRPNTDFLQWRAASTLQCGGCRGGGRFTFLPYANAARVSVT